MVDPTTRDTIWIGAFDTAVRQGDPVNVYDLADETGASVGTVRETLHVMTHYGILDRKQGENAAIEFICSEPLEWDTS